MENETSAAPAPSTQDDTTTESNTTSDPVAKTTKPEPTDQPTKTDQDAQTHQDAQDAQKDQKSEKDSKDQKTDNSDIMTKVAEKIATSQNVLIALSSDPSVDELATAIGLSLFLDRLGKRATAIYSGSTPNVLEFLKPDEVFEPSADALQDFVIAINKDKADHLRYKLDGDYVKIYITPFKNRISENDLNFSYGDFNVDLVLALDVISGVDLDSALREYGRIMHDATIIDITTGKPGKLGEIEWSDSKSSSVAEMISRMLTSVTNETIEAPEATAFLTGIVAATKRFSNARTTSDTMKIASELMRSGADQQLIAKNISPDVDNEIYDGNLSLNAKKADPSDTESSDDTKPAKEDAASAETPTETSTETPTEITPEPDTSAEKSDPDSSSEEPKTSDSPISLSTPKDDKLDIAHDTSDSSETESKPASDSSAQSQPSDAPTEPKPSEAPAESNTETAPAEKPAETASVTIESDTEVSTPPDPLESKTEAVIPEATSAESTTPAPSPAPTSTEPAASIEPAPAPAPAPETSSTDSTSGLLDDLKAAEESLSNAAGETISSDPTPSSVAISINSNTLDSEPTSVPGDEGFITNTPEKVLQPLSTPDSLSATAAASNPAAGAAPAVPSSPEINGIPEINYSTPTSEILPPPPAPPIDLGTSPMSMPPTADISQPASPTPDIAAAPSIDPGAFSIPS